MTIGAAGPPARTWASVCDRHSRAESAGERGHVPHRLAHGDIVSTIILTSFTQFVG